MAVHRPAPISTACACHGGGVAKRRDSRYRSGRCREWIKVRNRAHPAFERAMLIALNKRTVQDDGDDRSTRRLQAAADLTYMGRGASRQDRAIQLVEIIQSLQSAFIRQILRRRHAIGPQLTDGFFGAILFVPLLPLWRLLWRLLWFCHCGIMPVEISKQGVERRER